MTFSGIASQPLGLVGLEGTSLVLRRLIETDADQLFHNYFNSFDFRSKYRPHDSSPNVETTRLILKEHHSMMANSGSPTFEYGYFHNDQMCGLLTISDIDTYALNAQILFGVFPKHNTGLRPSVGEAILLGLDLAFNHIKLHRLYAHVFKDNKLARHSILHCGFKHEGLMREHALIEGKYKDIDIYACLKSDLQSNKNVLRYQKQLLGYKAF